MKSYIILLNSFQKPNHC